MGLALQTGILSDLKSEDKEGYDYFKEQFEIVYKILKENGVQSSFVEPENLDPKSIWSCQMYGYGGLHYLRRLAAHIWDGKTTTEPGNQDSSEDVILEKYYDKVGSSEPFFGKILNNFGIGKKKHFLNFDHLLIHSDAEGFYVPVEFKDVIIDENVLGGMLGSSYQLLIELEIIANWLDLDLSLDPESEEVFNATENKGKSDIRWKKFGIESYSCLNLYNACKESIRLNCAITFC